MKLSAVLSQYLLVFLAGLLSVFAYAPFNFMPAIVLSLLVLVFVLQTQGVIFSKSQFFNLGFIYGIGFFASQLYWIFYSLYVVIDTGLIVAVIGFIAFIGFLSLYIGVCCYLFSVLKTRFVAYNLIFLLPSLWVICEWLRGFIFTGFAWSDIAYTQVTNQFFRGVFAVLGSYGVSFILASIIGALYIVAYTSFKQFHRHSLAYNNLRLAIIYLVLIFLGCSLIKDNSYTGRYGKAVSVALLQGNVQQSAKWNSNDFLHIYHDLIAKAQADVIITPETAMSSFAEYLPAGYLANLITMAKAKNASLLVGMPLVVDKANNYVNAAVNVTATGAPYYAKRHLVPFGEFIPLKGLLSSLYKVISLPLVGLSSGEAKQSPLILAQQKFAVNICYENGFNSELIANAKAASVLANLSDMIWYGKTIAAAEHLQLSQARALENQRYFIQTTNDGITAIINPYGQIQAQLKPFTRDILIGNIYGMVGVTPFENFGNYPIILICLFFSLVAMISSVYLYLRARSQ